MLRLVLRFLLRLCVKAVVKAVVKACFRLFGKAFVKFVFRGNRSKGAWTTNWGHHHGTVCFRRPSDLTDAPRGHPKRTSFQLGPIEAWKAPYFVCLLFEGRSACTRVEHSWICHVILWNLTCDRKEQLETCFSPISSMSASKDFITPSWEFSAAKSIFKHPFPLCCHYRHHFLDFKNSLFLDLLKTSTRSFILHPWRRNTRKQLQTQRPLCDCFCSPCM